MARAKKQVEEYSYISIKMRNHRARVGASTNESSVCVDISVGQAQRFLGVHSAVYNLFNLGRHLVSANHYRLFQMRAFAPWKSAVA